MGREPPEGDAMPRTTKSPTKPKANVNATAREPSNNAPAAGEVLTLAEAAAYLRVPEAEVLRLVRAEGLPGRQVGEGWRFLKPAMQDWLRSPALVKPSKEALLARAGSWKDDPFRDEMLKEISRLRGRSMTEDRE
jgi:excisionase family DNA binding protein